MSFKRNLKGRRIAVLAADGFEKVELTVPVNDQELVRDGNLLTSRGPQDMQAFVPALLEFFAEAEPARAAGAARTSSDPQRDEPPALVVRTMQWMPRPSLRTAIAIGAIAAGVIASNRR